jgi:hypothetical protein
MRCVEGRVINEWKYAHMYSTRLGGLLAAPHTRWSPPGFIYTSVACWQMPRSWTIVFEIMPSITVTPLWILGDGKRRWVPLGSQEREFRPIDMA